jgi:hypothetical protein
MSTYRTWPKKGEGVQVLGRKVWESEKEGESAKNMQSGETGIRENCKQDLHWGLEPRSQIKKGKGDTQGKEG